MLNNNRLIEKQVYETDNIENKISILINSWKNTWKVKLNDTVIKLISFNIIDNNSPDLFLLKKDNEKLWIFVYKWLRKSLIIFISKIDIDTLIAGIKKIRELMHSKPMMEFCGEEIQPGLKIKSDKDLLNYIKNKAETAYHPVGTCKMGNDNNSVVDNKLKVHGIKNLRIADASIMPTLISGNTNAVCMMIGEKCSELILSNNKNK